MATTTIISETGFPHCAFRINANEWYGFKPKIPKFPLSPGHVYPDNLTMYIKESVAFDVPDHQVAVFEPQIAQQYNQRIDVGGICDCVTFVADVAERLGLKIPPRPNFWPDSFLKSIRTLNSESIRNS